MYIMKRGLNENIEWLNSNNVSLTAKYEQKAINDF